jgi:hypothetical protein
VQVADVLVADGEGYRGAWLIKGDALIGVDLTHAAVIAKDDSQREATIRLPQPTALQSRVDHARTRTWEVKKITWVPWGGDQDKLRDAVMYHAQCLVAHAAESDDNIRHSRQGAEAIIRSFYEEIGWRVRVDWEKAKATGQEPQEGRSKGAGELRMPRGPILADRLCKVRRVTSIRRRE